MQEAKGFELVRPGEGAGVHRSQATIAHEPGDHLLGPRIVRGGEHVERMTGDLAPRERGREGWC